MKELFAMIAKEMTFDQIVKKIQIDIDDYKEAKLLGNDLEKQKEFLNLSCYLLILNTMEGKAEDIIKDMHTVESRMSMFEEGTNQN
jgi:hypothetical protein